MGLWLVTVKFANQLELAKSVYDYLELACMSNWSNWRRRRAVPFCLKNKPFATNSWENTFKLL